MQDQDGEGDSAMTKFIENVNTYISRMKIKQTYIGLKSGIAPEKLSHILAGDQDASSTDMERIAGKLVQLMENIDEVLSAKSRLMNMSKELYMDQLSAETRGDK